MRIVEHDLELALGVHRVAERVLHFNHIPTLGGREEIVAHGNTHIANDFSSDTLPLNVGPRLDGESMILRIVAVASDEI